MSADDFMSKYASVMESMLKGAIAETTKLFETMVDELKAEISRIKKENEDLKTRCSQFENARSQTSDGSERRDRAVQCDLVPVRTMLVEECEPLRHSLQNREQQGSYEEMEYSLHDHTYGEGTTQMAFILVKQEDSSAQSVLMQEGVEPTVVCGLVLNDKAGSPQASAWRTENESSLINQECSIGEIPMPQKDEETRMAQDLPCLGMDSSLQGAQKQSSELEHSPVSQKISETPGDLITSEQHPLVVAQHQSEVEPLEKDQPSVVPQQCQREGETSVNEQADDILQRNADVQSTEEQLAQHTPLNKGDACEELKSAVAEDEAQPQPELSVPRRRGRPPKKAKRLQQPVKEIGSPEMEIGAIQAPPTEVSSAVETPKTSTVQPRERRTSVTLQDAMLLVEAMNQSTAESTFSSSQRTAARPQCSPRVGTLQTVEEVPAEQQTPPLPVETHKDAGNLPITERSITTRSTIEKLRAVPATANATPTNEAQMVTSSNTTSSMPSATVAVQTGVQSLQQHPPHSPITSVAHSKLGKAVARKVIVMPRSVASLVPHKIAALSPTQVPAVLSTVVAAQKKGLLSGSPTAGSPTAGFPTAGFPTAGLPLRMPSLSSIPQKTIYVTSRKSIPVVPAKLSATPKDPQLGTLPHQKITIIIPRQVSTVTSKTSQTIFLTTKQESAQSAAPVMVSPPKLISSPQELSIPVDTQTATDEVDTTLPQKIDDTSDKLESPKQTINAPTETCSSLDMSLEPVPTSVSPAVPPPFEEKLSAVVKLTRLPFPVSAKESILVSVLPTDGSSQTESILKEDTVQEKPSSVDISTQPSETLVLSTAICSNLNETSVALSVNTSQMSEEPNDLQEKASLSSENCTILEESPDSGDVQPSTLPKESAPVFENSTIDINTTKPLAISGTAGEPISNSDEEDIYEDFELMVPDSPIEEKQLAAPLQLTPITTKDTADPHIQMTKAQFLAQLSVAPVTEDPKEASSDEPVDATASCAVTCSSDNKKRLQKKSLVAQLRSHFKTRLQARTKTNPEPCTETETHTVNPKKPRLENDSPNDKNTASALIPLSPKNPGALEDVTSSTTDPPISPRRSGLCIADGRPKRTLSEPSSVRSGRFKATRKSTPVSLLRSSSGRDGLRSETRRSRSVTESDRSKKPTSTSMSPRRSIPTKENASSKKTKSTSVSPRRSISIKGSPSSKKPTSTSVSPRRSIPITESASSKKTKSTSVSPRRSSPVKESPSSKKPTSTSVSPRRSIPIKESASSKKTKNMSVSPRRSIPIKESASSKKTRNISVSPRRIGSTKDGASPKSTKSTSVSPKRTSLSRDGASPKKTKSAVGPRTSSLSKNDTTPKVSTSDFFCRRKCTFTKNGSGSIEVKGESSSFSARYSITTDGSRAKNTESEMGSPSVRWPKLAKDGVSPRKTGESTPVKRPRLNQDGPGPQKNLRVVNAKLAKETKAKKIAKMKNSIQLKSQNGAKTSQLAEHHAVGEVVRRFTAKAVWTPPRMPVIKTPPPEEKKEIRSPNEPLVFPPSVSLFPIPFRAPPVVSPLQPLSVIGRRLLRNQCGTCGRVLSSLAALESHVSLHTGRRPFSCTLCGKSFADSKGLKRHGRVHRNGRIHICQQCGKGFVYSFGLTKHLHMVHSRIKPFICQICNKGFFTKRDVEAHIRMHTGEKPFHCNLCEKKFARRVELNVHLRWHNGEKRHWCPFCGKGFLDFNNLKRHKYIHTGEKPHSCPHCPKNFTQSGHLKKHVKNVHKIL